MKISVLCFDLADNAAGRAFLLARLLEPLGAVEVVGPCYGDGIWKPVASDGIPCFTVPGGKLPYFAASLPALLRLADGDLLYASKPRLTSAGIGYLKRLRGRSPLLLDVDDWEVGFFRHGGFWGTVGRALNVGNPKGLPWTWLMERVISAADAVTVASRFLERRFGGTLIPHVRDTDVWKPECADPAEARRRMGAEKKRVVMFLGTPRGYKGVEDLCRAVSRLGRSDLALALVGTEPGSATGKDLAERHPGIRLVGRIPFADVPRYLVAADVVVIPQRDTPDTLGQTPAKLFDAMALGRPIVSTRVSMIPEILDGCGILVPPGDVPALALAIGWLLDHPADAAALGMKARARCVAEYSFAAARSQLFPLVQRVMSGR